MATIDRRQPEHVESEPSPAGAVAAAGPELALQSTSGASPALVMALQRSAGNAAVQRMLAASAVLSRQDGGTQTADAGTQTADAGTQTVDAGTQTTDAGTQTTDAGTQTADAGTQTADAGTIVGTPMPGPRTGLVILTELDLIHTRMTNAGYQSKIGSGFRTIDDQIKTYAKGRTFADFQTAINAAVTAGTVTQAKATEWIDYYNPAAGNHPMPAGEPGPVTWTFASRHLLGEAADIVDVALGWGAAAGFWTALNAAAVAEGLQIGPPASDVAHVQRP